MANNKSRKIKNTTVPLSRSETDVAIKADECANAGSTYRALDSTESANRETPLTVFATTYFIEKKRLKPLATTTVADMMVAVRNFIRWVGYDPKIGDVSAELFKKWELDPNESHKWHASRFRPVLFYAHQLGVGGMPLPPKPAKDEGNSKIKLTEELGTLWHLCQTRYFAGNLRITCDNTRKQYKFALQNLGDFVGHQPTVADLTEDNLVGMMRELQDGGLAASTVNEKRHRLCALWAWCAKKRLVEEFPTVQSLKQPVKTPRAWTRQELNRLFVGLKRLDGWVGLVRASDWWLGLHSVLWDSGARIGEILACQWEWLDQETGTLVVPPQARKGGIQAAAYRLHEDTLELLKTIRRQTDIGLIFPWPGHPVYLCQKYKSVLNATGLPTDKRMRFHQMRRSVASHIQAGGHDASVVLQHSSAALTRKSYLDPRVVRGPALFELLWRPGRE